jgi:hypothetical protein
MASRMGNLRDSGTHRWESLQDFGLGFSVFDGEPQGSQTQRKSLAMSLQLAVTVASNVLRIASMEVMNLPDFELRATVQSEIDDLQEIVNNIDRATGPIDSARCLVIEEFILGTCQAIVSHVISEGEIGCKLFRPELLAA